MAPTLSTLIIFLAWIGGSGASTFRLAETIDKDNFYNKFDFETKGRGPDPFDDNHSFVKYLGREAALKGNITRVQSNGDIYLGVDHTNVIDPTGPGGRDTFRIQSRESYKHGLFIARFSHLPQAVCGSWPAFWTLGDGEWPRSGEIDLYEGWNLNTNNKPAIHVGSPAQVGDCALDPKEQGSSVLAEDCSNFPGSSSSSHAMGQGCQTEELHNSIWASPNGGIQALLWTSEEIKIFTWRHGTEPAGLDKAEIDPNTWTSKPSVHLRRCDIDKAFQSQKIVFDIAFCGNPAGSQFWDVADHKGEETCLEKTKTSTCNEFVAKNPSAFKDVYFQIRDIRHFELKPDTNSSTDSSTTKTNSTVALMAPIIVPYPSSRKNISSSAGSTGVPPAISHISLPAKNESSSASLAWAPSATSNFGSTASLEASSGAGSAGVLPLASLPSKVETGNNETAGGSQNSTSPLQTSAPFSNTTSTSTLETLESFSGHTRSSSANVQPSNVVLASSNNATGNSSTLTRLALPSDPLPIINSTLGENGAANSTAVLRGSEGQAGSAVAGLTVEMNSPESSSNRAQDSRTNETPSSVATMSAVGPSDYLSQGPKTGARFLTVFTTSASTTMAASMSQVSASESTLSQNSASNITVKEGSSSLTLTIPGFNSSSTLTTKYLTTSIATTQHSRMRFVFINATTSPNSEPISYATPVAVDTSVNSGSKSSDAVSDSTISLSVKAQDASPGFAQVSKPVATPSNHHAGSAAAQQSLSEPQVSPPNGPTHTLSYSSTTNSVLSQSDVAPIRGPGPVESLARLVLAPQSSRYNTASSPDSLSSRYPMPSKALGLKLVSVQSSGPIGSFAVSSSVSHSSGSVEVSSAEQTSVPNAVVPSNLAATTAVSASTPSKEAVTNGATAEMATVTVYRTITTPKAACPPTVTPCPVDRVPTVVVPWYVTVCPVTPVTTQALETGTAGPDGKDGKSVKVIKTFRIDRCPPTISDCPLGSLGTMAATRIVCNGRDCTPPAATSLPGPMADHEKGSDSAMGKKHPDGLGLPTFGPSDSDSSVTVSLTITRCPPTATDCPDGRVPMTLLPKTNCSGPECSSPTATEREAAAEMREPASGNSSKFKKPGSGTAHQEKTPESDQPRQQITPGGTGPSRPKVTKVIAVTRCPPSATNCSVGSTSTVVLDAPCSGPDCRVVPAPTQPNIVQPSCLSRGSQAQSAGDKGSFPFPAAPRAGAVNDSLPKGSDSSAAAKSNDNKETPANKGPKGAESKAKMEVSSGAPFESAKQNPKAMLESNSQGKPAKSSIHGGSGGRTKENPEVNSGSNHNSTFPDGVPGQQNSPKSSSDSRGPVQKNGSGSDSPSPKDSSIFRLSAQEGFMTATPSSDVRGGTMGIIRHPAQTGEPQRESHGSAPLRSGTARLRANLYGWGVVGCLLVLLP